MATSPSESALPPEVFGPLIEFMEREGVKRVAVEALSPTSTPEVATLERDREINEDVMPDAPGLCVTHIAVPMS